MNWDLRPVKLEWMGMAIGAACFVSTPIFKLRYADETWRRCLQVSASLCGLSLFITIPLWEDTP